MVAQIDKTYKRFGPARILRRIFCYLLEGRPLLTRGRAFNPCVKAFLRLFSGFFADAGVDRPIFILGMGRSGTTFLGNALSVHPDAAYLNEPKLMWSMALPEDDLVGSYSSGPARYRMDEGCITAHGRRAIRSMYALCSSLTFSPRIVDKYPEMIFRLPLLAGVFPDAKFIAIVRSGHNVMKSVTSWNKRNEVLDENNKESWWGLNDRKWKLICDELIAHHPYFSVYADAVRSISSDGDRSAIEWILTMEEIVSRAEQMGDKLCVVRYEDLMVNPRETVSRIMRFCELADDGSVIDYVESEMDFSADVASDNLPDYIRIPFYRMIEHFGYQ